MQGVKQIKADPNLHPLYVFIKPPSIDELENRLRGRKTETEESIRRRLSIATKEIAFGDTPGNFDLMIVNDDIDAASEKLKSFMEPHVAKLMEARK